MPRKEKKVKIDERFQKMFTDKNFTVNCMFKAFEINNFVVFEIRSD